MEFKVNTEVMKFGKGNTIKDFYYYLLLSDFENSKIIESVKINKWWFNMLPNECKEQINNRIS